MIEGEKVTLVVVDYSHLDLLLILEKSSVNQSVTKSFFEINPENLSIFIAENNNWNALKQIRWMIQEKATQEFIGTLDFYNFSTFDRSVEVGVLIHDESKRNKGYAKEALTISIDFARNNFDLFNLHCSIQFSNTNSKKLFQALGFKEVEIKKSMEGMCKEKKDEINYTLCLKKF